jgi:phytoene desaturase
MRVAIIGGGVGGLAVACLLGKAGHQVSLYEQHHQLGGRAGRLQAEGFTFDTGPSWLLMPEVLGHFFTRMGERMEEWLTLERLEPGFRVVFADGRTLEVSDASRTSAQFEQFAPGAGRQLQQYHASMQHTYQTVLEHFLYREYRHPFQLAARLPRVAHLPLRGTLERQLHRYFQAPQLQQVLSLPSLFLGTEPRRTPSIYGILNAALLNGVWHPKGGIYKLVEALRQLGDRQGVSYHTGQRVEHIMTDNGQATGLVVNGKTIPADVVVSNAGLYATEHSLLAPEAREHSARFWRTRQWSPSALLLYLGVDRTFAALAHHTLLVGSDWHTSLQQTFEEQGLPDDPLLYVCAPSRTDPLMAPKGCENLFVLAPLPNGTHATQPDLERYATLLISLIEKRLALPGLSLHIRFRKLFGPDNFHRSFGTPGGAMLGLSHTLRQSICFRPQIGSKKIRQLYFVGADVQPGVGLPSVLVSAELLANHLLPAEHAKRNDVDEYHPTAEQPKLR